MFLLVTKSNIVKQYADIWSVDEAHPYTAPEGGESVADVANRFSAVLSSTETEFHGYIFLCIDRFNSYILFSRSTMTCLFYETTTKMI